MSESIPSTLISALPAATKVSDTDIVVLENGSTTQKITIAQLKEALGINALNAKISVTGTFTDEWYIGIFVYGMGLAVEIPRHNENLQLSAISAKVFNTGGWYNSSVLSIGRYTNRWRIILNTNSSMNLENGKAYLISLSGAIS